MGEQDDGRAAPPGPVRRVRMPIEDRVPPEEWMAEHPDEAPDPADRPGGRDTERVRSLPWGYR